MRRYLAFARLPVLCLPMLCLQADQKFESRREGHAINDPDRISDVRAARVTASASPNGISFHGGSVITGTVNVYYIWYGNWNGNDAVALLENLAQSIGGSPYFNINTTYADQNGVAVRNAVMFAGSANDNYSQGKNLSDGQVQQIVNAAIAAGKLPKDTNGVYFVLSSADVNETSGFCTQYCGMAHAGIAGRGGDQVFVRGGRRAVPVRVLGPVRLSERQSRRGRHGVGVGA